MATVHQEFNNAVSTDKTFIHDKTKGRYKVKGVIRSKHPDTGEWYDAVLYISLKTGEMFVRSYDSFIEHFSINN